MNANQKLKLSHMKKKAVLYIRQSTLRQVQENTESTMRQYALKERLITLGWSKENIKIIDSDLGISGTQVDRQGFKELVADVGAGEVGAVACIECSRLSRNSGDWSRLMEICALTKTLLIDADGIYDPNDFNDRILLGLKGTMSEAELHFIKARMVGGRLNKAKRGELMMPLPVGYVYDAIGRIVQDPNSEIRNAVHLLFDAFSRIGTARGTVVFFKNNGYNFPVDSGRGFHNKTELRWQPLTSCRVSSILHNPLYAGIYSYGKQYSEHTIAGKTIKDRPENEWTVRIENNHEGYISTEKYYGNLAKLKQNNTRRFGSPPREGAALLQGIAICGICGKKLGVKYPNNSPPYYTCSASWNTGEPKCQSVQSTAIDDAVVKIVLEELTPLAVMSAVEVEKEAVNRETITDNYFLMQIERADYELKLAKKRYMNVDPENRLVAFELERIWNEKMTLLAQAEEEYNSYKRKKATRNIPSLSELGTLAEDVHEIWQSPNMRIQDKKRILRCLIDDITIIKRDVVTVVGIVFKSGVTKSIECKNVRPVCEQWTTSSDTLEFIRARASTHTAQEISDLLNHFGHTTGKGHSFTPRILNFLMRRYEIPSLASYLKEQGYLTTNEKAASLGVSPYQLGKLREQGLLSDQWRIVDGKSMYMYAPV